VTNSDTDKRHAAYRAGLCIDCHTVPYSAGRPRCNPCHTAHLPSPHKRTEPMNQSPHRDAIEPEADR
jgi:hypothetical protein